jgi:hypothetical protein
MFMSGKHRRHQTEKAPAPTDTEDRIRMPAHEIYWSETPIAVTTSMAGCGQRLFSTGARWSCIALNSPRMMRHASRGSLKRAAHERAVHR